MNQALRIPGSSSRRIGDDGKVASKLTVELHFSDGIPGCGMKEKKRSAYDSKAVPDKIPAANVVKFMAQNVFEFGAVLLETDIWQQNDWAHPAECCRGRDPRQYEQSRAAHMKGLGKRLKKLCDLNWRLGGETEHPFQVPLLSDMGKENVRQCQQISGPDYAEPHVQREGP
jgi:hypothetical protein